MDKKSVGFYDGDLDDLPEPFNPPPDVKARPAGIHIDKYGYIHFRGILRKRFTSADRFDLIYLTRRDEIAFLPRPTGRYSLASADRLYTAKFAKSYGLLQVGGINAPVKFTSPTDFKRSGIAFVADVSAFVARQIGRKPA